MTTRPTPRVALVHDWLVSQRGGENVLRELCRLFPGAPIYTLVHAPGSVVDDIEAHPIRTSFLQRVWQRTGKFRPLLPIFPRAVESFDLSVYDLIVSTSHCVAKGVHTHGEQRHISYIHTPMRYIWEQLPDYLPNLPGKEKFWTPLARGLTVPLRRWDIESAQRPHHLIANSRNVAQRIAEYWRRDADVVYPPVEVDFFAEGATTPAVERKGYLAVSALVPYKRVDLAVRWATRYNKALTVIGSGSELPRLQKLAGPSVEFIGAGSPSALRQAYQNARALLFCGVEDFGIVPLEAMAAGCPIIARGKGGARETVRAEGPEATGVFFDEPTVEALNNAAEALEVALRAGKCTPDILRRHASGFAPANFREGMLQIINAKLKELGF